VAVKNFGVCDFSRLAVTDWRLWFLALMTATSFFFFFYLLPEATDFSGQEYTASTLGEEIRTVKKGLFSLSLAYLPSPWPSAAWRRKL